VDDNLTKGGEGTGGGGQDATVLDRLPDLAPRKIPFAELTRSHPPLEVTKTFLATVEEQPGAVRYLQHGFQFAGRAARDTAIRDLSGNVQID